MQQWIKDVDLSQVPNIPRTQLGACSNSSNSQAVTDAAKNGWWTCGAHTRASDITFCPNKNDWGASFGKARVSCSSACLQSRTFLSRIRPYLNCDALTDDGPSPYTPRLLNLLEAQDISTTFFIVGSRAISRPEMVQAEYMLGHQLSVHSWAHSSLTTLSNEEIVRQEILLTANSLLILTPQTLSSDRRARMDKENHSRHYRSHTQYVSPRARYTFLQT